MVSRASGGLLGATELEVWTAQRLESAEASDRCQLEKAADGRAPRIGLSLSCSPSSLLQHQADGFVNVYLLT